jgi:hypothetical protein
MSVSPNPFLQSGCFHFLICDNNSYGETGDAAATGGRIARATGFGVALERRDFFARAWLREGAVAVIGIPFGMNLRLLPTHAVCRRPSGVDTHPGFGRVPTIEIQTGWEA